MLRKFGIIAVLSLIVAAFAAVPALAATTIDFSNAPSGAHFKGAARPSCSINGTTVTCSSYQIAGVGNTNANATLTVNFTATVDCRNNGGKVVPVKASVQGASTSTGDLAPRNGVLVVPTLSSEGETPPASQFLNQATCPNGNWDKLLRGGTIQATGFTYKLKFVGFDKPVVKIVNP
jgi:hypothetical protein